METQKEQSLKSRQIPFDKMAIICSVLLVTGTIFVAYSLILIYWANKPSSDATLTIPVPTPIPTGVFTPSPTSTFAPTPTLIPTITQTSITTPIPTTQEPEVVAPLAGNIVYSKIDQLKFSVPILQINVGDTVVFDNGDDIGHTIVELDQKIDNITLGYGKRTEYVFDKAGSYRLELYSIYGRSYTSFQNINVLVNASEIPVQKQEGVGGDGNDIKVNTSVIQNSFTAGEKWNLNNGYYLVVNSISASAGQVYLTLFRNGVVVEYRILTNGQKLEHNNISIKVDRIYSEHAKNMVDLSLQ